ncbi:MAG: amidohydrolase [Bacteroidales bacterium]|nr:amidohydrolase [Bacteroidales bacterium]
MKEKVDISRKETAGTKAAETLILGNIITMDPKRPAARAALVKDGVFAYIGSAEEAKKLAAADARVLDYGGNFVYPGFMDGHAHGVFAGYRAVGQANLAQVGLTTDYAKYREIIKDFIKANPQREVYLAAGWVQNEEYVTKAYLDEICPDKPLIMNTGDAHSCLLNTKAMEWAGVDAAFAKKYGPAIVHVDATGEPDGYVCEGPAFKIIHDVPVTVEEAKTYILAWQDFALANGLTATAFAGDDLRFPEAEAYYELEREGKLKIRTYANVIIPDNPADPKAEIAQVVEQRAKYSKEYYRIIGGKVLLDGVVEAHTGWMLQDYLDQPGYHGVERFNDHDKMVELITAADAEGLSIHAHSVGNGATHFMLDCIEDAEKITGDKDQRNIIAHLQFVTGEDIRRMAETGTIPAVPPLWTLKVPGAYEQEVKYVGRELSDRAYPIKSFFDAGAYPVFHSDYPVSPYMDIKLSIYMAEKRAAPQSILSGDTQRNIGEAITREQSLRAMTVNVARQFHQEHRLGSIEFGKLANMTVYDCDFLHDDIEKVADANLIATIVDGEEAYKA